MTHPLRIAFMGTPDFAVTALQAVHRAGHEVVAVYCQPPKPAGRGQQVQKTAVHVAAEALGIAVRTPKTLRDAEEQAAFAALDLDVAVVAAYGLILPQAILSAPKHGCLNIHGSLLPRWRGAAPLQRAMLAGDSETGITIMQMDAGLDTGAMLIKDSLPITAQTTAQSLHDALASMGARLIVRALDDLAQGNLQPVAQPEDGATYAKKVTREDGKIEWGNAAAAIERQIRALHPWPGCVVMVNGEAIKVLAATVVERSGAAGVLLDDNFTIACGQQALRLDIVQRAGKKAVEGAALLRGMRLGVGIHLSATQDDKDASTIMPAEEIQSLELVDDRFPTLLLGEKTGTIRWNEGHINEGYLVYYASHNPLWKTIVWVTRSRKMSLADVAAIEKTTPEKLCAAMQRHYPNITQNTEVLFVEHLTPQQTEEKHGIPLAYVDKVMTRPDQMNHTTAR